MEASDSLLQKKNKIFFVLYLTHPHHMRHTFCTRLCEVEENIKVAQDIMGHADVSTTLNIYAEASDTAKLQAVNNMQKIFDIF